MLKTLLRAPRSRPTATVVPTAHRDRYGLEVAYYHTTADLADCLHTPRVNGGRLVVVLVAHGNSHPPRELAALPDRLILTTDTAVDGTDLLTGWFEPDPRRAVIAAMTGLQAGDTLLLLLPASWTGPAAEELIDHARRWRSSPHSGEDDVHFG